MESLRQDLFQVHALVIAATFFIIIYVLNWLGYAVKKKISERHPDRDFSLGTAEGALIGLMALLLAFTFGMASTKFESRRQTIIDEANLLNSVYLRCTLYPDSIKQSMLHEFKNYVNSRVAYYDAGDDPAKISTALKNASNDFNRIWNRNTMLLNDQNYRSRSEQLAPALINLRTIAITRESGRLATVPTLIISVLLILVFMASFLTGFGLKPGSRNLVFSIAFAAMTSVVLYLVMELGRPRQGCINLENAEKEIISLRNILP